MQIVRLGSQIVVMIGHGREFFLPDGAFDRINERYIAHSVYHILLSVGITPAQVEEIELSSQCKRVVILSRLQTPGQLLTCFKDLGCCMDALAALHRPQRCSLLKLEEGFGVLTGDVLTFRQLSEFGNYPGVRETARLLSTGNLLATGHDISSMLNR